MCTQFCLICLMVTMRRLFRGRWKLSYTKTTTDARIPNTCSLSIYGIIGSFFFNIVLTESSNNLILFTHFIWIFREKCKYKQKILNRTRRLHRVLPQCSLPSYLHEPQKNPTFQCLNHFRSLIPTVVSGQDIETIS